MTREELTDAEIEALISKARVPAIAMLRTPQPTDAGTPGCWFGGAPTLPTQIDWPTYKYAYGPVPDLEIPLHFLAQINLEHVPKVPNLPALPRSGTLFLFFDPLLAAFGDIEGYGAPWPLMNGSAVRVIHVRTGVSDVPARPHPKIPNRVEEAVQELGLSGPRWGFRNWPMNFVVTADYIAKDIFKNSAATKKYLEIRDMTRRELFRDFSDDEPITKNGLHTIFGGSKMAVLPDKENMRQRGYRGEVPYLNQDKVMIFRFEADEYIEIDYMDATPISFWLPISDLQSGDFTKVTAWGDV